MKKYFPIQAGFLNKTVGHVKAVEVFIKRSIRVKRWAL
ncbi:hypothetical protein C2W64_00533 [Brevibacillus laterosporus]|nr:hypothetical protein C2W64_00533 [Brevibacillus laterosporus]